MLNKLAVTADPPTPSQKTLFWQGYSKEVTEILV